MVFFFLCLISVIEVFSASSELTFKGGSYLAPMLKHIGILIIGIFFTLVTLNIKCKYFKIATPILLAVSFFTLIWVLQVLSAMQTDYGADRHAMNYILTVCAFIVPLIAVENLSTAALLCVVIFMMMIIGRVPIRQLLQLVGGVTALVVVVIGAVMLIGEDHNDAMTQQAQAAAIAQGGKVAVTPERKGVFHRFDTWKSRIDKFANKRDLPPDSVDLDKDAQTAYANIAIVSSNIIGKGPGNSVTRDFLPQAFSDYIYAIIIEEMGILGAIFVALLYIILLFRTGRIANRCANNFPAFLAMGLALLLVTQALFNMCVAVGIAPVTGQPLPLISKGGTSSIINCIYIGAILSVSRTSKKNEAAAADDDDAAVVSLTPQPKATTA